MRFSLVTVASEHAQLHVEFRTAQPAAPSRPAPAAESTDETHSGFRLPSLRGRTGLLPSLGKAAREERAEEKARQGKRSLRRPRSRPSTKRRPEKHGSPTSAAIGSSSTNWRSTALAPTVVPGPVGSPALETTDPVDILNSVTVEGWKLVTGKFLHSEMRNGAVGVYLFKRSQKRRLAMNNPWRAPEIVTPLSTLSV